jgi:hypothetical protein
LKHLLGMLSEAMGSAWTGVLTFKPEIMRFESDPRMVMIANPSDVIILCSFEITGRHRRAHPAGAARTRPSSRPRSCSPLRRAWAAA